MIDPLTDPPLNPNPDNFKRRLGLLTGLLAALALSVTLAGCAEKTVALSVLGYNHAKTYIYVYWVNGAMLGSPLGPISPGEKFAGGAAKSCCVVLPAKWRPGLKAHIVWYYGKAQSDPNPIPPPREADVEIPEYKPDPEDGSIGNFFVHFYPDHQVRIVVNPYYPESSYSPDPDLSPVATGSLLPQKSPPAKEDDS